MFLKAFSLLQDTLVVFICALWPFIGFSLFNSNALSQNLNQVHDFSIYDIYKYASIYLISCLLCIITIKLLFRKINLNYLSSIIAALSLCFTTFQIIITFTDFLNINRILYQHIIWFLYFLLTLSVTVYYFKYKEARRFFLLFSTVLVISTFAENLYQGNSLEVGIVKNTPLNKNIKIPNKINNINNYESYPLVEKPNIFFIIMDEYAREDVLLELTEFDNSPFIKEMEAKGFYNFKKAHSNYIQTNLSIPTTLHMDYNLYPVGDESKKVQYSGEIKNGMGKGIVELKKNGYKYFRAFANRNIGESSCPSGSDYCAFGIGGLTELEATLLKITPLTRPLQILFPKFMAYMLFSVDDIRKFFPIKEEGPVFTFAHILQPHAPYIYKPDCSIRNDTPFPEWNLTSNAAWSGKLLLNKRKKYYIENVQCANIRIKKISDWIIANYPNSIIIIQGDHGTDFLNNNWSKPISEYTDKEYDERFSILSMIKLPKSCEKYLYPEMTSVNTFRLVLGCLSNKDPQYISDDLFKTQYEGVDSLKVLFYRTITK